MLVVLLLKMVRKEISADPGGRVPQQKTTLADPAVVLLLRMVRTEPTADPGGRAPEQQPTLADPGGFAFENGQRRIHCRPWWSCS